MPLIETKGAASAQGFGEFAQSAAPAYIEDVFSTYLYTGNGSTQTITNGIDLSGKGGLVWLKGRSTAGQRNGFFDTQRGVSKFIWSDSTAGQNTYSGFGVTAFSTSGFTAVDDSSGGYWVNGSGITYASWTFRKQAKFFDVVTYTGDGTVPRSISHGLGSVPGFIAIKLTSGVDNWICRHRSAGDTPNDMTNYTTNSRLFLNLTNAASGSSNIKADASTFTVNHVGDLNTSGQTYVAYLFAHDAGGFGLSGTDNVISCGSWTGTGTSPGPTITLGWEPQLILYKRASGGTGDWGIHDNMRSLGVGTSSTSGSGNRLEPNTSDAETGSSNFANISATGFTITPTVADINASGSTYIYIAIRRGPMKVPTSGTQIANPKGLVTLTSGQTVTTGFVTDMTMAKFNGTQEWLLSDRLRNTVLYPNTTDSEGALYGTAGPRPFDVQDGFKTSGIGGSYALWGFRRAPGFFDVVCYTGDGINGSNVSHNLGSVPELILMKKRSSSTNGEWTAASKKSNGEYAEWFAGAGAAYAAFTTAAAGSTRSAASAATSYTASFVKVGNSYLGTNDSGSTYVAYLFATVAGVSKVGSYTGSGTTKQIDCGFTAGARFVLIKRTDSTGNWHLYDSGQGIVAGNDPYFLVNTSDGQYVGSDYVDTYSAGFELSSTAPAGLNANGGTYIFLAIA